MQKRSAQPKGLSSNRARLDARMRGASYRHLGVGSLVIDVGTAMTKMGVVGDLVPTAMVVTPPAVVAALQALDLTENQTVTVAAFVTSVVMTASQAAANIPRSVILLCDALSMSVARPGRLALAAQLRRLTTARVLLPLSCQAVSLAAFGLTSGVVVDIGYAATRVVPVIGTVAVDNAIVMSSMGVRAVLRRMAVDAQLQMDVPEAVFDGVLRAFGAVPPKSDGPQRAEMLSAAYLASHKNVAFPSMPSAALESVFFDSSRDAEDDGLSGSLGRLVVAALLRCDALTQRPVILRVPVVLIGGGAAVPNMALRLSEEVLAAAGSVPALGLQWSPPVVQCPLPVAPALLAVVGACTALA